MTIPLLIYGDAVSAPTGLARIARDLAIRIHDHLGDVIKVATIGYGGSGSTRLPFPQYFWTRNDEWIIHDLPEIWDDFAQGQKGIFLTIQDISRMLWLARPESGTDPVIAQWLKNPPFEKWGYFPIDSSGPNGKLTHVLRECLWGYDRILTTSKWSENVVLNTLGIALAGERDLQSLPHGIDTSVFYPRDRAHARRNFCQIAVKKDIAIADDEVLIGIVATNQARKDFGLAIRVCAELAKTRKIKIWIHTDALDRTWSIPFLLFDYGLMQGNIVTLNQYSDDTMAQLYSACDVTLGIGLGEGFGYPIFESLACGVPCVHGDYGGASEHLPPGIKIKPTSYRYDGVWNCVRPVFEVEDWVDACLRVESLRDPGQLPTYLDWNNLWPRFESWFRKGLK